MKMDPDSLALWQAITHKMRYLAQNRSQCSFCTLRHFVQVNLLAVNKASWRITASLSGYTYTIQANLTIPLDDAQTRRSASTDLEVHLKFSDGAMQTRGKQ
jgi:hypothetical protein